MNLRTINLLATVVCGAALAALPPTGRCSAQDPAPSPFGITLGASLDEIRKTVPESHKDDSLYETIEEYIFPAKGHSGHWPSVRGYFYEGSCYRVTLDLDVQSREWADGIRKGLKEKYPEEASGYIIDTDHAFDRLTVSYMHKELGARVDAHKIAHMNVSRLLATEKGIPAPLGFALGSTLEEIKNRLPELVELMRNEEDALFETYVTWLDETTLRSDTRIRFRFYEGRCFELQVAAEQWPPDMLDLLEKVARERFPGTTRCKLPAGSRRYEGFGDHVVRAFTTGKRFSLRAECDYQPTVTWRDERAWKRVLEAKNAALRDALPAALGSMAWTAPPSPFGVTLGAHRREIKKARSNWEDVSTFPPVEVFLSKRMPGDPQALHYIRFFIYENMCYQIMVSLEVHSDELADLIADTLRESYRSVRMGFSVRTERYPGELRVIYRSNDIFGRFEKARREKFRLDSLLMLKDGIPAPLGFALGDTGSKRKTSPQEFHKPFKEEFRQAMGFPPEDPVTGALTAYTRDFHEGRCFRIELELSGLSEEDVRLIAECLDRDERFVDRTGDRTDGSCLHRRWMVRNRYSFRLYAVKESRYPDGATSLVPRIIHAWEIRHSLKTMISLYDENIREVVAATEDRARYRSLPELLKDM